MKKLYLVDVSSMFFRAFFALPPLSNDKGLPTNALYGFLNMSVKLLRDIQPDYIVFCFDSKEPSFRHDIYSEYKANRDEMPSDLVPQVPFVKKISEELGVPILEKPGYEADDLIGTLTKFGRQRDLDVVIVSGDKDFAQLIEANVCMYDTMKEVRYDREGVKTKWGVEPEQMIDYLALVGDASDNVPGVKGIGPKGACKLLAEFKTLDGVYENIDKVTAKAMKANLETGKKNAFLSRQLCTIHQDVEHHLDLENLKLKPIDKDKLRELLLELGFKTFAKTLTGDEGIGIGGGRTAKELITKEKPEATKEPTKRKSAPRNAGELKERAVTIQELDKTVPPYAEVWGILTERGFFLGYENEVLLIDAAGPEIGKILGRKQVGWKGFDLKSIWHFLSIIEPIAVWDSMLAAYILRPGNIKDLNTVFEQVLGKPMPELITPIDLYNANREIQDELIAQLKSKGGQSVLDNIETPLVPVLFSMERKGVRVDLAELSEQAKGLDSDVKRLEAAIHESAGGPFNISSPKQLAQILFGKLGLEPGKKTKTGFSTDSDVLEKLKSKHPVAALLLEYRELSKLKSTYVDALPALVKPDDGRVHSTFNQASTTTGRLSSQNPNLQNIPIRTTRGRLIRKAFVPAAGHTLIAADYSQIELRILAHITSDEGLIAAFNADLDIHQATAAEVFGVPLKEVTSDMRRKAKAVNFGIAYGQGAFGLAETLGIGRQEATDVIARYFNRYKKVRQYMEDIVETAKRQGFVETVFGRRRYIDELKSSNGAIRKFGERAAINAPIQGTASDLVKMAMLKVHDNVGIPMVLQVHDELLFECPKDQLKENCQRICDDMMNVTKFVVPLKVNVANGDNWEDAHS